MEIENRRHSVGANTGWEYSVWRFGVSGGAGIRLCRARLLLRHPPVVLLPQIGLSLFLWDCVSSHGPESDLLRRLGTQNHRRSLHLIAEIYLHHSLPGPPQPNYTAPYQVSHSHQAPRAPIVFVATHADQGGSVLDSRTVTEVAAELGEDFVLCCLGGRPVARPSDVGWLPMSDLALC